jgi:Holliday junction resolvase RusA-like endonuclease
VKRQMRLLVPKVVAGWELWLPPPMGRKKKWLSLNDRSHWGFSSARVRYWRGLAREAAETLGIDPPLGMAHVVAVFTFGDNRRRDVHNYMPTVKAAVDGCTDAGLWVDDRDGILTGPDLRRDELSGYEVGLLLRIYEVNGYV